MGKLVRMTLASTVGAILLILVATTTLHASAVPEIDPTNSIVPAVLVAGAVLVIRGRIKR